MTINKPQSQTYSNVLIDLQNNVFSHGHLYVANSRVRFWSRLKLYLGSNQVNNKVKNYVFKEIEFVNSICFF